jgi:glycosyltransferase involved in cell wall biosynthesis
MASQPFFQWRGSSIRVGFDVRALAALGYEVDLLVLPVGLEPSIPGVRIVRVPNVFGVKDVPIGPSIVKALFDLVIFCKGLWMAWGGRYAVIHGVEDAAAVGVFIAGLTGSRLVFEKHSDPSSYRKGLIRNVIMRVYAAVERFVIRHADAVIGTGPGLVRQIVSVAHGKPVFHIFDIPSSLDEPSDAGAAAVRDRLGMRPGELLVTYVGSFSVYQGIDVLFAAIPRVVRQMPDVRVLVIGGSPTDIAERRQQLANTHSEDRVVFAGKVDPDRLPDYLRASDILLSPRQSGVNTPLKILDYLKAGRAIVATNVESNRLLLTKDLALLTAPDAAAFGDGIITLAGDPGLREALGSRGRQLMTEHYTYAEFQKQMAACYAKVLSLGPED